MIYGKPARKRRAVLFGILPVLFALVLPAHPQEPCQAGLKPEVEHLLPLVEIAPTKIRVVTFNVHYAHDIPELAKSIQANPALRTADIFLIQEIESYEEEGESRTRKLARRLHLNSLYAPARPTDKGGTHGLAILSRFPLVEEQITVCTLKRYNLVYNTRRRIWLAATVDVAGRPLRVYNVHLDTRINRKQRIEQLRPMVEAALRHEVKEVVAGGDVNTLPLFFFFHLFPIFFSPQAKALDRFMQEKGFDTPLAKSGSTTSRRFKLRLDALYSRGVTPQAVAVERSVDVSDHFPVWMEIAWPPAQAANP